MSSRERSTSRGRGAARSSSRESGRGGRGRGRPARPSPSPTGLCRPSSALPCPVRGGGWGMDWSRGGQILGSQRLLSILSHPILGSRLPRFDPTAFVKAKEKKQKEIKMKLAPISSLPDHIPVPLPGPLTCAVIHPRVLSPSPVACSASHLPLPAFHLTSAYSPDPPPPPPFCVCMCPYLDCDLSWVTAPGCDHRGAATPFLALVGRTGGRLLRSPGSSSSGTDWAAEEAGMGRPSPGLARLGRPLP